MDPTAHIMLTRLTFDCLYVKFRSRATYGVKVLVRRYTSEAQPKVISDFVDLLNSNKDIPVEKT
jgi:hypothetical protein